MYLHLRLKCERLLSSSEMWINEACTVLRLPISCSHSSLCVRVIVDEIGRGTSTRDGLTIALAIAEALVSSRVSVEYEF